MLISGFAVDMIDGILYKWSMMMLFSGFVDECVCLS